MFLLRKTRFEQGTSVFYVPALYFEKKKKQAWLKMVWWVEDTDND